MNCITVLWSLELGMHFFIFIAIKQWTFHPMRHSRMLRFGLACSWGTKSKIYIYVYIFNEAQMFSNISCHSFNSVPQPGQSKPFQCFCSASVGRYLYAMQPTHAKVITSPHLSPLQTHRTAHGKGRPNSCDICFHNAKLFWWKILPWSPLHQTVVISLSSRPP